MPASLFSDYLWEQNMTKLSSILVVVDPTVERDFVVERAVAIAKLTNVKVTLFINHANTLAKNSYVYEGIDGKFFETQQRLFEQHYRETLRSVSAQMTDAGIETTTEFNDSHNLAEAIIEKAKSGDYDLVMKSTHHHGAIDRLLVTNTDWRLIRKCQIPLLMVKPYTWKPNGAIVTAVDPMHVKAEQSALDKRLLETAQALAHQLAQTPHVFHSYFPFESALFPLAGESAEHIARIKQQHQVKLNELLIGYGFNRSNVHLSKGELVPSLLHLLKQTQANLLVIGALSRNALERAIVGNTAEKILETCPCDVLVTKTSAR
ncbi:MAG: universal stress protein E [Pseudohongiellaceae bacterium]|jgi:universal stress protein E